MDRSNCERCGGLLHEIRCYEADSMIWLTSCMICGDKTDPIIEYHRTLMSIPDPGPAVIQPVYYPDRWEKLWKRRLSN